LDNPPAWLGDFVAYLVRRHHPSRACKMLTRLGNQLADNHLVHPQTLLESVDADGPLARALEDFFTARQLALPPDREDHHAAGRRQSRIDAVPEPLRPAVTGFTEHLVTGRDRARRTGTHPRGHATLEARLSALRDFTQFLTTHRHKTDWATVDVSDIEAFLHTHPNRRAFYLTGLRQFCRYALRRRLMLIDPTIGLNAPQTMAFRGPTLPTDRQRELFQRWSTDPCRTRTRPSSDWPPSCMAPPLKNCSTSPTTTSTTTSTASRWALDRTPHRWTHGPGPRCNAASITARHWPAPTPTC
jgi:hypothetical protein